MVFLTKIFYEIYSFFLSTCFCTKLENESFAISFILSDLQCRSDVSKFFAKWKEKPVSENFFIDSSAKLVIIFCKTLLLFIQLLVITCLITFSEIFSPFGRSKSGTDSTKLSEHFYLIHKKANLILAKLTCVWKEKIKNVSQNLFYLNYSLKFLIIFCNA